MAGAVRQIAPHRGDREDLLRVDIALHQRPGDQRPDLLLIVAVAILLIEFVHQRVERYGLAYRRDCLAYLFIRDGFELGVVEHGQHRRGARQLLGQHLLQVRLPGLVWSRGIQQR